MDKYRENLATPFELAIESGFMPFRHGVGGSNPINSTPFFSSFEEFARLGKYSSQRLELINSAKWLIRESFDNGLELLLLMVGGSFLDISNLEPNDMDCVAFYKVRDKTLGIQAHWISTIRQRAKDRRLDARFIPTDANLLVLLRSAIYFSALFGESKAGLPKRGVLLVDCADTDGFVGAAK
jgi:hypothetical protein